MPLTIEEALKEISVLKTARVVAGEQNLNQVIRWTHIIDHPDILPWAQAGHLLLTTAFSLMLNPDTQVDLILRLTEKNLAGMMVNVGRYMGEIPPAMVAAAQKLNFPLIALPWDIDFTDVTHAIHERIISEQYALSEQADHIHEVLTKIVVEGGGLDILASRLADLLQRSVTIEDVSHSVLAYKSLNLIDDVRVRSIAEGHAPAEVVDYHTRQGLYERLRQERRPQKVDAGPELGLTLERVVAPIIVGPQILGYIWVIATDHPLTGLDFLAIERGATLAALILSREQAVYEAEQRVKNKLFDNLLEPQSVKDNTNLSDLMQKLGMSAGYQIIVLESRPNQAQAVQVRIVENCTREEGVEALIVERGGRLVVTHGTNTKRKASEVAALILARGKEDRCNFVIGISSQVSGVGSFRTAYEEALKALQVGYAISPEEGVWSSDKLGYILELFSLPDGVQRSNSYRLMIANLTGYDEKHNASLLKTLRVYIDQLTDIQKTAQALYIHRNTLYQRLKKIGNLCQVDLNDVLTLFNIYLALKEYDIQKSRISE